MSSPDPPLRISFPAFPLKISLPSPPLKVLAPLFPRNLFAELFPVASILVDPVRFKFSTSLEIVNVAEE